MQKLTNVYTFDDSFHNSAILNCVRKLHSFNVCVFVGQQISESCMKLSLKTVYLHAKYNHRNGPLSQIENDFEDTCHWLQKHISETTLTSPFHRHYQLTQHPFSGSLCPCAHLHTICAWLTISLEAISHSIYSRKHCSLCRGQMLRVACVILLNCAGILCLIELLRIRTSTFMEICWHYTAMRKVVDQKH